MASISKRDSPPNPVEKMATAITTSTSENPPFPICRSDFIVGRPPFHSDSISNQSEPGEQAVKSDSTADSCQKIPVNRQEIKELL
jgi:hypothetical protein